MTVVIPCHKGDQHQAERLLKWIAELGQVDTKAVLFCAKDCNHPYLLSLAQCAFTQAIWLEDAENIKSNWMDKSAQNMSAEGPNSLFRQLAWYMYLPPKGPWLFLEPDCIVCRKDWYTKLRAEYEQVARPARKPLMGFRTDPKTHPGSLPIPVHLSGVAIYPAELPQFCPEAIKVNNIAFDVAGAKQMMPLAHFTNQIFHHYCAPSFASMEEADVRVKPEVCIYHANKDGSLIPFLRQRLGMAAKEEAPKQVTNKEIDRAYIASVASALSSPTCDIFIKTHAKDYDWLEWCLRSIEKFATGFREVVIVSDTRRLWDAGIPTRCIAADEIQPGYLGQQYRKLYADKDCPEADFILYMDSDCVFTAPVTPQSFFKDGKPFWLKTPFGDARSDQQVWKPIMEKFVGRPPQHEFMRRHPFMVPREALGKMREFCRYKHGMELRDYIMAQHVPGQMLTFSEWNCLGFFLHEFHPSLVTFLDTTVDEIPPAVVWQGFTHAGEARKHEDIAKFREILGAETKSELVVDAKAEQFFSCSPKEPTVAEAIEVLVREASRAHVCKGRVLTALKKAGLVKGGKLAPLPKQDRARKAVAFDGPVPYKEGILLAIHSYPGANDVVARHWPYYYLSGATRIVGIGTTDGKCKWPVDCEEVQIGKNSYINGEHLPQRLVDTLEWCLSQPEDKYIIAEYDVLFLGPMPPWEGFCANLTGGQLPDAKATRFFHPPWLIDRKMAALFVNELKEIIREGHCKSRWPEASPDVALGFAADRLKITPHHDHFKLFSRNSLNLHGDLEKAIQAARDGVDVIHGVKTEDEFLCITSVLTKKKK